MRFIKGQRAKRLFAWILRWKGGEAKMKIIATSASPPPR